MGISPASQIEIRDVLAYEPSTRFLQELAPSATSDLTALLRLAVQQCPELRAESNLVQALFQYNAARDQLPRAVGHPETLDIGKP